MRRFVKNTLLVLLLALLASRADSTSIRATIPLPLASDKTSVAQDFGHAKEGTKESFTEGRYTKAIHQIASSPFVTFRVLVPSSPDVFSLHFCSQKVLFRSAYYYSSFCNKAPPEA
jgi:hypothetical protein